MGTRPFWTGCAAIAVATSVAASEAPRGMTKFNQTCPAPKLLPELEKSYQACMRRDAAACDRFVAVVRELLPEYDCQRKFDASPTANYIVPAIWLAGDQALDRYFALLARLGTPGAREVFASAEFRAALDGMFAELYLERSEQAAKQRR